MESANYQPYESAIILKCYGCDEIVIAISLNYLEQTTGASARSLGIVEVHGEPHFYYPSTSSALLDPSIPADIASCFMEAQQCLSVGANRASVVMCRNALALFVEDKGSPNVKSQPNLFKKLEEMKNENTLLVQIHDWASLVRFEGNAGAHQEDYEPVDKPTAEFISEVTRQILYLHYEVPSTVSTALSNKTPKKP